MRIPVYILLTALLCLCSTLLAQVNFTSSNLPIIVIDTNGQDIPDEPKIDAMMGIIDNGPGNRNFITNPFNNYDGHIGIEIRGSSSQGFPKKQFAIETRDSTGENNNVPLLGMPPENDWVLYAPFSDKSLMRNVLAYYLANRMGHYATRTRFCEVVINNTYRGVYVLMEKIKRDNGRVDIKKLDENDISGDDLTGGYILKIDKTTGANNDWFTSAYPPYPGAWQEINYLYHYPAADDILDVQKNYIQNFINQFETRMFLNSFNDPFEGYYDIMDVEALVDYFLLNELSKNVDGYRLSAYLYKDRDSEDGRIVVGPAWDYNLGFGNADYYSGAVHTGWQMLVSIPNDSRQVPFWWKRLIQDAVFMNQVRCRFRELSDSFMHLDSLHNWIDANAALLNESQQRNFQQWPILSQYVWPNAFIGGSYPAELGYLKDFITSRLNWMSTTLSPACADVDWVTELAVETGGSSKTIPLSSVYTSAIQTDSITFVSEGQQLLFQQSGDSVTIFGPNNAGEFNFKAAAWFANAILDYSPNYVFRTDVTGISPADRVISRFELEQNYPNPFNGTTLIAVNLRAPSSIDLSIFDLNGQKVATLKNGFLNEGRYISEWNGINKQGVAVSSGVYLYRLTVEQNGQRFHQSRKLLYLK
ncbi:MAG: CotH kinase family protein [Calditrichota bacterium]